MWKQIDIDGQTCFLRCGTVSCDALQCVLYDFAESWSTTLTAEQLMTRVEQLNKRIHYDEATVRETLRLVEPELATWMPSDADTAQKILKLRYRVDSLPFHFEWTFKRQTAEEFRLSFILPLFKTIHGMEQQVAELREIVRKKDVELLQYRKEGAVLVRTTVATTPFDSAQFDEDFAEIKELSQSFQIIGQHLQSQFAAADAEVKKLKTENRAKTNETSSDASGVVGTKKSPKMSPRNRKRKMQQFKQQYVDRKIESRKLKLVFESCQTDTDNDSQKLWMDSTVGAKQTELTKEDPQPSSTVVAPEIVQRALANNNSSPTLSTRSAVVKTELEIGPTTRSGQIVFKCLEPEVSPPKIGCTTKLRNELEATKDKKREDVGEATPVEDDIGKDLETIQNIFKSLKQKNYSQTAA